MKHLSQRWKRRALWASAYAAIVVVSGGILLSMASRIQTYALPQGNITLATTSDRYMVGESIAFTVTNSLNSTIHINNDCPNEPLNVYRKGAQGWQRVHATSADKSCKGVSPTIAVAQGKQVTANFDKWPSLFAEPGVYRIVLFTASSVKTPYRDIEIVAKPVAVGSSEQPSTAGTGAATSSRPKQPVSQATSTPTPRQPQAHTVNVTDGGNYSPASVTMLAGDTLRIKYVDDEDEVVTRFTPSTIASIKVDSEHETGSRTFPTTGTWTAKAVDHNGNTLTIIVQ